MRQEQTQAQAQVAFDPKVLTSQQNSNEGALPLDLNSQSSTNSNTLRMRSSVHDVVTIPQSDSSSESKLKVEVNVQQQSSSASAAAEAAATITMGRPIQHNHMEHLSLDDLFPNLSVSFTSKFHSSSSFRNDIRHAMRYDIFYTTPAYANLSPKVASYMLDDDSSLQGSWNCIPKNNNNDNNNDNVDGDEKKKENHIRMTRLTAVLKKYLGDDAPTGDQFMMKIGSLCGVNPSNHWIDIIGVKDRMVSHSWHQDTGRSFDFDLHSDLDANGHGGNGESGNGDDDKNKYNLEKSSRYTVMLGFPPEDNYTGTGVFSHAIKLTNEQLAPVGHNDNEPVLYEGEVDEEYIVRPLFSFGREILRYRDVDTLHSAPDVVYRKSVMRFM